MATPSLQQARSHYADQRKIAAAALVAIRALFRRGKPPLVEVATTVARYQLLAATVSTRAVAGFADSTTPLVDPMVFAGVSSAGFPISEPIIATIDRVVPAPPEALPDSWWTDAETFMTSVEQLIVSEVQDAGRTASQAEFVARPEWTNYVRMINPPSCARCAILAGRIYRDLEAFDRHPGCDCVMVPVESWQSAHDEGLVVSAKDAFEKGSIRTRVSKDSDQYRPGLSRADAQAVRDGADIVTVVNATRGTSAPGITNAKTVDAFGHRVKATTYGTTRRAAWRRANPTRLVRLRPEAIYQIAKDREDAIRLLGVYGYFTP